ncbi:hypothetical protein BCR33DRAFT_337939 [Rhizoclosmatium globosum]|uniref:DNA helicase Pif1-like 2B domain-containing protein n=1 Tax=Rhizoclosmatium globosum TaxID=329046 RepID=A0A1Y2C3T1_9FUNG|nr:hypothetical protein BCR33DRAFT_337939 [Rhizoclosmatium globosum]|eukprot:ORY41688.1 hypothetical protein BCR33DRAFT_337939 [Rhizoclosmatium globosum]
MAPETLDLKIGAQVMLIKNKFTVGLVNGSMGRVIGFEEATGCPVVDFFEGPRGFVVGVDDWKYEVNRSVKATREQVCVGIDVSLLESGLDCFVFLLGSASSGLCFVSCHCVFTFLLTLTTGVFTKVKVRRYLYFEWIWDASLKRDKVMLPCRVQSRWRVCRFDSF